MGLRDTLQAIRGYPTVRARLEAAEQDLRQARTALEKSKLECQRLSGDYSEARHRLRFSEKKAEALQSALDAFCPKLASLEEMTRFYDTLSPSLAPQGFTLYHTAEKMTGIDLYGYFAYEDSSGLFEEMDGRRLLRWLTAARFGAVDWEIVTGTIYEEATLREVDTSTPEYQAFEAELYRKVLERMGFGDLLVPEEVVKSHEVEVISVEEKTTELKLYSPLLAELFEADPDEEPGCGSQILTGENLAGFQAVIRQGIEDERMPGEAERGLMTYFDGSESVDEKVASINIDVEEVDGELFGVAVCKVKGRLSPGELEELKEFCTGQYSDGWGEGYEQRPRRTDYGSLYVSFWDCNGFFLRTRDELEAAKAPARPRPQRGDGAR